MIPVVAIARTALSARSVIAGGAVFYDAAVRTGFVNADTILLALRQIGPRMARRARAADGSALQEMVNLAKSRAPVDSGRLLNGIEGYTEGEFHVFKASAVRTSSTGRDSADYARFVEFGTAAGVRSRSRAYQAQAGFYDNPLTGFEAGPGRPTPRRRRQYRGHPGTRPQPFFYNSAREVMEKRFMTLESLPALAATEEGL